MRPISDDGADPLANYFGHWMTEGHAKAAEAIYEAMHLSERQDATTETGP